MTSDDQLEARLRRLLTVRADQLTDPEPRLTGPALRARAEPTGRRFVTPVLAAAAVLALFLLPVLLSRQDGPGSRVTPGGPVSSTAPMSPRHDPTAHESARPAVSPRPVPTLEAPSASPGLATTAGPTRTPATSRPVPSRTS